VREKNGTSVVGGGLIGTLGSGWSVVGTQDFNNDGRADLLLQNGQTPAEWQMNGTTVIGGGTIGTLPAQWSLDRRLQWRRQVRHPAAERPATGGLGDERRDHPGDQRRHRLHRHGLERPALGSGLN
jgi:hypothetical protein